MSDSAETPTRADAGASADFVQSCHSPTALPPAARFSMMLFNRSPRVALAEFILLTTLAVVLVLVLSPAMAADGAILNVNARDVVGFCGLGGLAELLRRALNKLDDVSKRCDDTHTSVENLKVEVAGLNGRGGLLQRFADLCDEVSDLQSRTAGHATAPEGFRLAANPAQRQQATTKP